MHEGEFGHLAWIACLLFRDRPAPPIKEKSAGRHFAVSPRIAPVSHCARVAAPNKPLEGSVNMRLCRPGSGWPVVPSDFLTTAFRADTSPRRASNFCFRLDCVHDGREIARPRPLITRPDAAKRLVTHSRPLADRAITEAELCDKGVRRVNDLLSRPHAHPSMQMNKFSQYEKQNLPDRSKLRTDRLIMNDTSSVTENPYFARLEALLTAKGEKSIHALAIRAGVSAQALYSISRRPNGRMNLEIAARIADELGVPIEALRPDRDLDTMVSPNFARLYAAWMELTATEQEALLSVAEGKAAIRKLE